MEIVNGVTLDKKDILIFTLMRKNISNIHFSQWVPKSWIYLWPSSGKPWTIVEEIDECVYNPAVLDKNKLMKADTDQDIVEARSK